MTINKPQLLTLIKKDVYPYALYKCECGGTKRARRMDVKNNLTRSCGCLRMPKSLETLFFERVNKTETCWEWVGHVTVFGYGVIQHPLSRRKEQAHRVAYRLFKGEIPEGLVIDHLCNNTRCVNPDHLEAVTQKVNVLRSSGVSAINSRKTVCKRGHPLTGKNLELRIIGGNRRRTCKECKLAKTREWRQRNRKV